MQESEFASRLKQGFPAFTPAGKRVATYLLANLRELAYETADGIASRTGVTGITVGRFLRRLGYRNLDDLKRALRGGRPWLMTDRLGSYRALAAQGDTLARSLDLEKRAIEAAYDLARTPEFQRVVERIAEAEAVFLVGIQSTRGIVNSLFCHLEYIRPRVYYVDGLSGTYVESLNSEFSSPYLVITDLSAYSVMTRRLCAAACARNLSAALVCDKYLHLGPGLPGGPAPGGDGRGPVLGHPGAPLLPVQPDRRRGHRPARFPPGPAPGAQQESAEGVGPVRILGGWRWLRQWKVGWWS